MPHCFPGGRLVCRGQFFIFAGSCCSMAADICFSVAVLGKVQMIQSPYTGPSPASWYNREESHSGQLYLLWKVALPFCPEYDTSLTNYTTKNRIYIYFYNKLPCYKCL